MRLLDCLDQLGDHEVGFGSPLGVHLRVECGPCLGWLRDYWSLVQNFRCIGRGRTLQILHTILAHTHISMLRLILNLCLVDLRQFRDFGLWLLQISRLRLTVRLHKHR